MIIIVYSAGRPNGNLCYKNNKIRGFHRSHFLAPRRTPGCSTGAGGPPRTSARRPLLAVAATLTSSDRTKSEERASAWDDLSPPASRIFSSVTNKDNAGEQMSCKH